jgi:hypothetical protein
MHMDSTLGGSTFTRKGDLAPADSGTRSGRMTEVDSDGAAAIQGQITSLLGENRELRAELECLKAERAKMAEILFRLTEVLGSKSPDKLVHDVRNVLNERELYRTLADSVM